MTVQVLQKLPVTVGSLKQGTMGKLIKQLSKQEHPGMNVCLQLIINLFVTHRCINLPLCMHVVGVQKLRYNYQSVCLLVATVV